MARQHHQNVHSAHPRDEVHSTAASLANEHTGLDPAQTAKALRKLIDAIDEVARSYELIMHCHAYSILDDAIKILGTQTALSLVLEGDTCVLVRRILAAEVLAKEPTPLYSLDELASKIERFVDYLTQDRDHFLTTGLPRRCFRESRWLYQQLAWLYDTRCTSSPYPNDELSSDWTEDTPAYSWECSVAPPLRLGSLEQRGNRWQECTSEEADYLPGLKPEDAARLETDRPTFFEIKVEVLRRLAKALQDRNADNLWEKCLEFLVGRLTADEVRFYLRMDAYYLEAYSRGSRKNACRKLLPGGLTDLLEFVGYVGKEVRVGTMAKTRQALADVSPLHEGGGRPFDGLDAQRAYFESIKRYGPTILDRALDQFLTLTEQEAGFWTAYWRQISDYVVRRFFPDGSVKAAVAAISANTRQRFLQSFAELSACSLEVTHEEPWVPIIPPEATEVSPTPNSNRNKKALVTFPSPADLRWEEVTLTFVSKEAVLIEARNIRKTHTYAELGFKDGRRGDCPDSRWHVLRCFAPQAGEVFWEKELPEKRVKELKTAVKDLRKRLKGIFGINDDPFEEHRRFRRYRPKFHVVDRNPPEELRRKNEDDDD